MASYSSRDLSLVPQLTFSFVEDYISEKKQSSGNKSIGRGFRYYSENYIHGLSVQVLDSRPVIQGKCYHSQKNTMNVTFESEQVANVVSASCSCPIGQTGACGHVVGLLYQLAKFKMLELFQKILPKHHCHSLGMNQEVNASRARPSKIWLLVATLVRQQLETSNQHFTIPYEERV